MTGGRDAPAVPGAPSSRGRLRSTAADLDQPLICAQEFASRRPCFAEDPLEVGVGRIAARDPNNLRRRAMHSHEINEIAILGQHNRAGSPGREEDL